METQADYEADVNLAVFRSQDAADIAARALRTAGIEHTQTALLPGRYQVADPRLRKYTRSIVGAAVAGAVVGAIIGVAFGLWLFGSAWHIATWLGVAGAGGGAVIGGLVGLQVSARYDADVAGTIEVAAEPVAVLITTRTSHASPGHAHEREILRRTGAIALLDVPSYEAQARAAGAPAVVESTSVGDK